MTKPLTTEEVIKRFIEVHGNRYNYSKVKYKNSYTKVIIICTLHGEFKQIAHSHMNGCGCPYCKADNIGNKFRSTKDKFIQKAKKKFKNKYNYDQVVYRNCDSPVLIKCNKHKIYFKTTPFAHLKGQGSCPSCRYEIIAKQQMYTTKEFIEKSQEKHQNKYNYSKVNYKGISKKVLIICPIHGEFKQLAGTHLNGGGCILCTKEKAKQPKYTTAQFIQKATEIHNGKYNYSKTIFTKSFEKVLIICPTHGEFWQIADAHLSGKGCKKCVNQISKGENELYTWIKSLKIKTQHSERKLISPYEIDIYLPEYNIGIEYNGVYWHCEKQGKHQNYHKNKTELALNNNIYLLQFWDKEWLNKKDIVKSIILNALHKTPKKIFAKNLQIKKVSSKEARNFCNENHLHGFRSGKIYLSLQDNQNEIQSLMITGSNGEMIRYVSKLYTTVVGGFSKLLKYSPVLFSYVDARIFRGEGYLKNGFKLVKWTKPNYFYTKDYFFLESRQKYQKHKLPKILTNFDQMKTEKENMSDNGYDRLWDCGHLLMKKVLRKIKIS